MKTSKRSYTMFISSTAMCAALYAVASALTAPIPTPWGVGHFRPGVVVPAIFAVVSGPLVAGCGAALGTFIASFILMMAGTSPLGPFLSIMSGTPGNFFGFYLLGWFLSKFKSWRAFLLGSFIALFVGNLIAASGVMAAYSLVWPFWAGWPFEVKVATVFGFTFFWLVTMLPFVAILTPPVVKALSAAGYGSFLSVGGLKLDRGKPSDFLHPSIMMAAVLTLIYILIELTPLGFFMFAKVVKPEFSFWAKTLFPITAAVMLGFGAFSSLIVKEPREEKKPATM